MDVEQEPRRMRMEWSTDHGVVVFEFPSDLTEADVADVEELFAVTLTGMRRRSVLASRGRA